MDDTIRVALRVRPLSDIESARGCQPCLDCVPNEPQVVVRNTDKSFTYNFVFGPNTSQSVVYESAIKDLVSQLFKGYNVTILAYGQTGSGKTYSMGTSYDGCCEMGIIPRAISDIFSMIKESPDQEFKVTASFMELYKEQLYDLLSASKSRDQCVIDIREDSKGIIIPGLTEIEVSSTEETFKALMMGSSGRATGATNMNAQSSRSHAIFTLTVNMRKKNNEGGDMVSKFHLVDLAGSERPKKTGATGERFKEGININKGLLALGNVISSLGDGQLRSYVSYRDSKLTRLLQDSLGGNSMTLMVACVSPADYNLDETLSTLRYADRARHIKNKPIVNQDPRAAEILRLQKENTDLRLQLISATESGGVTCPQKHSALEEENAMLKIKLRKLTDTLNNALNESTNLVERALLAETARDRLVVKLAELSAQYNQTLENFDQSFSHSPSKMKDKISMLKDIQSKIGEVQAEQQRGEDEIKKHELSISSGIGKGYFSPLNTPETPPSLDEFDHQEEKLTLQQAERNMELQELTRALAIKEQLAAKLAASSSSMSTLTPECESALKDLEKQINDLQQERDMLLQQLHSVQSNKASSKIAEQRRKRLQELESKMTELKKKLTEQSKLIRLKEKSDEKIVVLNKEIRSMKATKVRLIRQMRQENEQFRAWKIQREKELNKLRDQDRKRQNTMSRMENMHSKQQIVLKRKVEEAAAINKRLKEALLLQKQSQERRHITAGKPERVQSWVAQELEIAASTTAAVRVREKLIEDRAVISKQLAALEESVNSVLSSDNVQLRSEFLKLKEDLQVRSAQIADINQKILDSDQENKTRTRWDTLQSIADTKCALKYLFELAVDIRKESTVKECAIEQLEETLRNAEVNVQAAREELKRAEITHKNEILALERDNAEKVSLLLRQLQQPGGASSDSELRERLSLLEDDNKRLQLASDELENLKVMFNEVKKELTTARNNIQRSPEFKTPCKPLKTKTKPLVPNTPDIFSEEDSLMEDGDDDENDPDWQKTPLFKRLQKIKRKTVLLCNSNETSVRPEKRISDSTTNCNCSKGNCRKCACRKARKSCSDACKCNSIRCCNRFKDDGNNESSPSISDDGSYEIKRARNDFSPLQDIVMNGSMELPEKKYFP